MWNRWRSGDFSFPKFKSVEDNGADPVFIIMGVLTSLCVIAAGLFILLRPQSPVRPPNQDPPRSTHFAESLPESDVAPKEEPFKVDRLLRLDGLQLFDLLLANSTKLEKAGKSNGSRVDLLNERLEISRILTLKEFSPDLRTKAVKAKLLTLSTVYSELIRRNAKRTTFELPKYSQLIDELEVAQAVSNPEVAGLAKIVKFQVDGLQKLNGIEAGRPVFAEVLANETFELMKESQQDEFALSAVDSIIQAGIRRLSFEDAKKIVSFLQSKRASLTPGQPAFRLIGEFQDEIEIREAQLNELFEDRWVIGQSGQLVLLSRCIELLQKEDAGMRILGRVDQIANWFEQEGRYQSAKVIYDQMIESAPSYKDAATGEMAVEIGGDGVKRGLLAGKKVDWDFSNQSSIDSRFSSALVSNKVVVVMLWSIHDVFSIQPLHELHIQAARWPTSGIVGLAINVDGTDNATRNSVAKIAKTLPLFTFLVDDLAAKNSSSILAQCPGKRVPRYLLIDHSGLVVDVNIPFASLKTEIEFLAGQRARENSRLAPKPAPVPKLFRSSKTTPSSRPRND